MKNKTKKIILGILAIVLINCLSIIEANSQKNLQFNDVKLITTEETVPPGMVWKIENVLPNTRLTSAAAVTASDIIISKTESFSTNQIIKIDNVNIFVATSDSKSQGYFYSNGSYGNSQTSNSSATVYGILNNPIWLPAGTKLAASTGVYAVSVIEFIATTP